MLQSCAASYDEYRSMSQNAHPFQLAMHLHLRTIQLDGRMKSVGLHTPLFPRNGT